MIREIKKLCNTYNVECYFKRQLSAGGLSVYWEDKIYILDLGYHSDFKWWYMSVFFHELGHIHAFRNKKWPSYHYVGKINKRKWKLTALKAEVWVDKWAEQEYYKHFPNNVYNQSYRTEEDKNWFRKNSHHTI